MPSIDRNRVIGKDSEELDEFTCGICQDIFKSPTVTPCCRQTYCKDCITEWLTAHDMCPNDRQPLTTSGLTDAPRLVVNFIDKMKIKCVFNEKGCPSVHTIAQDANHSDVCPFAKCGQCGCKAPDSDHNCLSYLLEKTLKLTEDNEKLKSENEGLEEMKKDYNRLASDYVEANHWKAKAIQLERELALVKAITKAKGGEYFVNEKFNLHQSWENTIIVNCKDVIGKFSAGKHSSKVFAEMIKARLDKVPNSSGTCFPWTVSVYANELPDIWKPIGDFVRLSFGNLIIVVS